MHKLQLNYIVLDGWDHLAYDCFANDQFVVDQQHPVLAKLTDLFL
jgi:hypothetical protein